MRVKAEMIENIEASQIMDIPKINGKSKKIIE
jgi:hypothetical protein